MRSVNHSEGSRRNRLRGLLLAVTSVAALACGNDATTTVTSGPPQMEYATTFDGTEDPLSEGGVWSNSGRDWNTVRKSGGIAFGTQTGTGGYDDSYAILSGFPPDQSGRGVVQLDSAIDTSCTHEVEVLLRWTDAPGSAKGYECNISFDGGYAQIVRWNGPQGDFTILAEGSVPGLKTGDTLAATAVGNVITLYLNDAELARATDASYPTGNPGIGFFRRDCGTNADFAFTRFSAAGY